MPATLKLSTLESNVECNGTEELLVSNQEEGETLEDFNVRHKQVVADYIANCGGSSSEGLSGYFTPVVCNSVTTDVVTQQGESQTWEAFLGAHHDAVREKVRACA